MLCKVKTTEDITTLYTGGISTYNEYTLYDGTMSKQWYLDLSVNSFTSNNTYLRLYANNTLLKEWTNSVTITDLKYVSDTIYPAGTNVKIKMERTSGNNNQAKTSDVTLKLVNRMMKIMVPWKALKGTTIWNLSNIIIYGAYDGNFYSGIMIWKDTTVSTGSITLGKAVWFITVNLNWEIVKIPYYWE